MFAKRDIQIKDNSQSEESTRPLGTWSGSIYEHASKLVTATYLVTSLFQDSEPLKGHLRIKSLEMLSDVVSYFRNRSVSETRLKSLVEEIMSLIHTGAIARVISPMNKNVLMDEYGRFLARVTRQDEHTLGRVADEVGDLFVNVSDAPQVERRMSEMIPETKEYKGQLSKGHIKKTFETREVVKRQPKSDSSDRKEKILSIIKQKGDVTIKDIASDIEGVSEKTVQRDLIELLGKGSIKKRGERRWTTYSIA